MNLTKEILQERKTGIGGSECAAVLGISKWGTALDIYLSKINPDVIEQEENDAMRDGHDTEAIAIKRYEEATGTKVEQPNKIFKNEKYPWLLANVDGLVKDKDIILEAKSTKFFRPEDWGEEGSDDIPTQYLIQCAHYCIVLDKPRADLAAWSFGEPLRIYHYERNKNLEEKIISLTHDFWHNHVLKEIPPNAVNNDDILKLYKKGIEGKEMIATAELSALTYEDYHLKKQIKELTEQEMETSKLIKLAMKDCTQLVDVDGTPLINWSNQESIRFNSKEFKASNNRNYKLYEKYCYPSVCRVFRNKIKEQKND